MGFMMQIRPEALKRIREDYPVGSTVEAVELLSQQRKVPAGTRGRVLAIDKDGSIHCLFENGMNICCVWGFDEIKRID